MSSPHEIFALLEKDSLYQDYKSVNIHSYLSHFFSQTDNSLSAKGSWDVGIYNKDHDKITIFSKLDSTFEIKPEDDVFKKPQDSVDELDLTQVTLRFEQAQQKAITLLKEHYPTEVLGDGFVVLQSFKGKVLWNFSSITRTLKFVNVKIDAQTGDEVEHNIVELIQK